MSEYSAKSPVKDKVVCLVVLNETVGTAAQNYSDFSLSAYLYRSDGYDQGYSRSTGNHFSLTANGSTVSVTGKSPVKVDDTPKPGNLIATASFRVPHNADGSKSFAFDFRYWNTDSSSISSASQPIKVTGTVVCTNIPQLSTISVSGDAMGEPQTITIDKANANFRHTIRYTFAGKTAKSSAVIVTKTSGTSYTWTPDPSVLDGYIPDRISGVETVYCDTYNGDTLIGTTSVQIKLKLPYTDTYRPSLSVSKAPVSNNPTVSSWGIYLSGYSRARLTITASAGLAATGITSVEVDSKAIPWSSSAKTWDSAILSASKTFTVRVTDSRGRTRSTTVSVTVTEYKLPRISSVSVRRCNSSGTADPNGAYLRAVATVTATPSAHNSATMQLRYAQVGSDLPSPGETLTSGTAVIKSGIGDAAYQWMIVATDALGNTAKTQGTINSKLHGLSIMDDVAGAAIGERADEDGIFKTPWTMRAAAYEVRGQGGNFGGVNTPIYWNNGKPAAVNPQREYNAEFASSSLSVPNNTRTELGSLTLDAGSYILICTVEWAGNANGIRDIGIVTGDDPAANPSVISRHVRSAPVGAYDAFTQLVTIVSPTEETTYYLNGLQTSGGALTAYPRYALYRLR